MEWLAVRAASVMHRDLAESACWPPGLNRIDGGSDMDNDVDDIAYQQWLDEQQSMFEEYDPPEFSF